MKNRQSLFVSPVVALTLCYAAIAVAADEEVETVIVTGSLIPQSQQETAVPLTVISADEMQKRGFVTVADALQQSTFSTGSVQGPQYSGGFTPGAQTLSMFGLSPSYVKYLIDGRPISDYPALYNGTDAIASITGIPIELVDHIDVLPGGQSSIYGSDAIAGVVNVVMKKKLDAPIVDARLGGYKYGGGTDRMVSFANSFSTGALNLLVGAQFEKVDPIWGYQRPLTDRYYTGGTSPQTAERDVLIYGVFGDANGNTYYFEDPDNCGALSGEFGNTLSKRFRSGGRGYYCGTTNAGYYTIGNGDETAQAYVHGTFDVNSNIQLYGDLLLNHDITKYNPAGTLWWGTSGNYGYYYDPNFDDYVNIQVVFAPEVGSGITSYMNTNTTNAWRSTLGAQGPLWSSDWTYDIGMTHTEQKLVERTHVLWNDAVESYYSNILGPDLGPDPYYGYSTFEPDYAQLYQPISAADYDSFSGYASSLSKTFDNMARLQLTDRALFRAWGGDAGVALVAEAGNQGWKYDPDPGYLNGGIWGYTASIGAGHRSRYALTGELRLPVLPLLTTTLAGRYDAYKTGGETIDKATYTLGLEFRPFQTLLFRGRYGTSFKAPTLADQYQGQSGYYQYMTDYVRCAADGYRGSDVGDCDYYYVSTSGTTTGNLKLKPITAKNWDLGFVWSPADFTLSADLLHWDISNEITSESSDLLLRQELECNDGTLDPSSPTCVAAYAQIHRDAGGALLSVDTPKVNVSNEVITAFALSLGYRFDIGQMGSLAFKTTWNDLLKHTYQQYSGEAFIDLLTDPTWSYELKSKVDASLTWSRGDWDATLSGVRKGRTPNYLASQFGYDYDGAGKLPAWVVANFSTSYRFTPKLKATLTVDNVFNRMPPADHSYPGTSLTPLNIFNYDNYGTSYYAELSYKFR